MANNLKKFTTEAEYSAATLNYPAVSWVTSGDTVHFDKAAPVVVNDKMMLAWTSDIDGNDEDIVLFNGGISGAETAITSVTLNDVDVLSELYEGTLQGASVGGTDYLAKIGIVGTEIGDYFSGDLGGGFNSSPHDIDVLIPSQITEITHMPYNTVNWVLEATTPPTCSIGDSDVINLSGIYVPTDSLSAYQTAWGVTFGSMIYPISDYEGNLPV